MEETQAITGLVLAIIYMKNLWYFFVFWGYGTHYSNNHVILGVLIFIIHSQMLRKWLDENAWEIFLSVWERVREREVNEKFMLHTTRKRIFLHF